MKNPCCAHCVFAGPVQDGEKTLYICSNVPDCPGRTMLRPPDGVCPHFRRRPERTPKSPPKASDDPWVRYIPLTQGMHAIVDASDYGWLSLHNWSAKRDRNNYYAMRRHNNQTVLMHQEIMLPAEGYVVDHISGQGWDNRRGNLRNCTRTQNSRNRRKQKMPCSSVYKGVSRDKETGKCRARIGYQGKRIDLGKYDNEIDAARAYDRAAVQYHGRFACLNFPEEWVTGRWIPVDHDPGPEDGGPKPEDGGQKTEDGQPRPDDGKEKTKDEGQGTQAGGDRM